MEQIMDTRTPRLKRETIFGIFVLGIALTVLSLVFCTRQRIGPLPEGVDSDLWATAFFVGTLLGFRKLRGLGLLVPIALVWAFDGRSLLAYHCGAAWSAQRCH